MGVRSGVRDCRGVAGSGEAASVKVFGRLFELGQSTDEVAADLERHVRVDETINSKVAAQ